MPDRRGRNGHVGLGPNHRAELDLLSLLEQRLLHDGTTRRKRICAETALEAGSKAMDFAKRQQDVDFNIVRAIPTPMCGTDGPRMVPR